MPCGDASIILKENSVKICDNDLKSNVFSNNDNGDDNEKQSLPDNLKVNNDISCSAGSRKRKLNDLDINNSKCFNDKIIKVDDKHVGDNSLLINNDDSIGDVILSSDNIYRTGAKCLPDDPRQDIKSFSCYNQVVGVVRTKPGRGDPTLSVSCSDKIARWIAIGIQV